MSLFSSLFGTQKKAPTPNQSIDKMKETLEILEKRESLLNKKIDIEVKKAKELLAKKNKQGALLCMKKKKTYEEQLTRLGNQKLSLENMIMKMEEATIDMETLDAQRQGADSLKKIYGKNGIDKIDKQIDEIRDVMDTANEISNVVSQAFSGDIGLDDDELLGELEDLEEEDLAERMIQAKTGSEQLSTGQKQTVSAGASSTARRTKEQTVEDEFAALEASL